MSLDICVFYTNRPVFSRFYSLHFGQFAHIHGIFQICIHFPYHVRHILQYFVAFCLRFSFSPRQILQVLAPFLVISHNLLAIFRFISLCFWSKSKESSIVSPFLSLVKTSKNIVSSQRMQNGRPWPGLPSLLVLFFSLSTRPASEAAPKPPFPAASFRVRSGSSG